jgi:predicted nucleotidyltransferase
MDITSVFKSKTRAALFRLFFTNPDSQYYLRELELLLSIPVALIRKELLRLEEEGVFVSTRKGNLVFYSLDKSYPLFDELKSIVLKTVGAVGLLKETMSGIKGVEASLIYGSFARSEERAGSDIDLLIIGEVDENILVNEIKNAEKLLKREVNYVIFRRPEFKKRKKEGDPFIKEILKSPKVFLVGVLMNYEELGLRFVEMRGDISFRFFSKYIENE